MLPGVGFFGSGKLAEILIKQLKEIGFHIEGIWSITLDDTTKRLCKLYSIPHSSTIIDKILLLSNVQLIVISCPPHYHNQIAIKACGIGKHVICDWPPSYTISDTINMYKAALNYPSLITLFLTGLRFLPTFSIIRRLIIDDNFLGFIRLINANVMCDVISVYNDKSIIWDKHMGGGLLSLYGTNLIDIISFITDYRAYRVHGMINCFKQLSTNAIHFNTTEDFVNCQMELQPMLKAKKFLTKIKDEPIIVNIQLNGHYYNNNDCRQPKHEIYIYGTNGYLVFRDGDLYSFKTSSSTTDDYYNNNQIGKEILLYKLQDTTSTPTTFQSSTTTTTTAIKYHQTYNVYPKIYLISINLMIQALKNAFQGTTITNDNSIDDLKQQQQQQQMIKWIKDPVNQAITFDDGIYLQTVLESIRKSSDQRQWICIKDVYL